MNPYQQNFPQNNGCYNTTGQSFGNPMAITEFPPMRSSAPQLGYPNAPGGQQMPQAYPQIPQAHPQIPQVYPQIPQSNPYQGINTIPSQSFPSQGFPLPAPIGFVQSSIPQGNQVNQQSNQFQGPTPLYNQPQSQRAGGMPGGPTGHYHY